MCSHEDDWHFYFDYADMMLHLKVKGKQIKLPDSFKRMVKESIEMHQFKEQFNKDASKFFNRTWGKTYAELHSSDNKKGVR